MSDTKQYHQYPLRLPLEQANAVAKVMELTGLSANQIISLCVRRSVWAIAEGLETERLPEWPATPPAAKIPGR